MKQGYCLFKRDLSRIAIDLIPLAVLKLDAVNGNEYIVEMIAIALIPLAVLKLGESFPNMAAKCQIAIDLIPLAVLKLYLRFYREIKVKLQ